ncbi:hypothetical protein ACRAR1_29610 [Streptomyces sanyensis]|uniref:hypothetical protein n=1 Tax=Streptomyces sanyensis TaxID=568869 RepID=UPI003D7816C0
MALPDITGSYEELIRQQARQLEDLKVRAGNPSLRTIEKRAQELFADEGVSVAASTQSGLFNGRYADRDKLLWLVRTLMSWDPRTGKPCTPRGAPCVFGQGERGCAGSGSRAAWRCG